MDYIIKQGDSLSSIAKRNNVTVASLQAANNISNPNFIKAGGTLKISNTVSGLPSASNVLPVASLTSENNLQGSLQAKPATPVPSNAPFSYAQQAQDALNAQSEQVNPYEVQNNSYIEDLKKQIGMQNDKSSDLAALNESKGVNTNNKLINDISSEILGNRTQGQIQKLDKGKAGGLTVGGAQNIDGEIDRQTAIRNLTLGSQLQAAQGNLSVAKDLVEQSINAKYEPIQNKIEALKQYLDLNKDALEKFDKKAYANQQTLLAAKQKDLELEIKKDSDIQNMIINASSQGATRDLTARAAKAKTPSEAAIILGQFAGDYYKTELLKSQIKTDAAQRANYNASAAKTRSETTATDSITINGQTTSLSQALSSKKISEGSRTKIIDSLGVVESLKAFADRNKTGNISGVNAFAGFAVDKLSSPESIKNRADLNAIELKVQQWASGASLTTEQIKQVSNLVPKASDTDSQAKTKTENLVDFMNNQIKATLKGNDIEYNPEKVKLFDDVTIVQSSNPVLNSWFMNTVSSFNKINNQPATAASYGFTDNKK